MNPAPSQQFNILCEQDQLQKHATLDKNLYCVYGTLNAVDSCCANVERVKRELLQWRPRPGGLVCLAGGLPLCPFPPSLFLSKCPPPFTQFQVFSTQVLAFVLSTCWVWHSHHASTSPSSTLCLLACALRAFLLSSLRVPRFLRRRCPNFSTAGTVAAGNDFALLGCTTTSR